MGLDASIFVEQKEGERWRAFVGARNKPSRFCPAGAGNIHLLVVSGWILDEKNECIYALSDDHPEMPRFAALAGRRGIPPDVSAATKKQIIYDVGDDAIFTWFAFTEAEAHAENVDTTSEFTWFYEILRSISHLLDTESLRFIVAFY